MNSSLTVAKPSSLWPTRIWRIITNAEPSMAKLTSGHIRTGSCIINMSLGGMVMLGNRNTERSGGLGPSESKQCNCSVGPLPLAHGSWVPWRLGPFSGLDTECSIWHIVGTLQKKWGGDKVGLPRQKPFTSYYAAPEQGKWLQGRWIPATVTEPWKERLSQGWWLPVQSCDLQDFITLFWDVHSPFTALLINILS